QVLSLCLSPQQERPNPQRDTRERPEEVPRLTSVDHEPDQLKTGKTSPGLTSPVRSKWKHNDAGNVTGTL
ncbi:hypothetical protein NQ294_28500, partial [Escherichia coli]|nr:hypothetical protein [Escherichia coli]